MVILRKVNHYLNFGNTLIVLMISHFFLRICNFFLECDLKSNRKRSLNQGNELRPEKSREQIAIQGNECRFQGTNYMIN